MRILIIHFGGVEDYSNLFIKSLLNKQHEIIVFAPTMISNKLIQTIGGDSNIRFYEKPRMRSLKNIVVLSHLVHSIKELKPDIIHLMELYPWVHLFLKQLSRFPIVLTLHDPVKHSGDIESKIVPEFRRRFFRYISHFVVLGKTMRDNLVNVHHIAPHKISVLPHGIIDSYLEFLQQPEKPKDSFNILFFGRLYRYKGVEYLIKAEESLSKSIRNYKIIIAGRGSRHYIHEIENLMRNKNNFILHNSYISNEQTAALFRNADVVVLPYVDATQSGITMVAYSFNIPVIVTNVGSLPEYVDNRKTGLIVPAKSSEAIAEAIKEIYNHPEFREEMSYNIRQRNKTTFSWGRIGDKMLNIYTSLGIGLVEQGILN